MMRALFLWLSNISGLALACIASVLLLVGFSLLHAGGSPIVNMPMQWLWVSAIPIFIALIAGGYVGKLKAAGIEVELDPRLRELPYVSQRTPSELPLEASVEHAETKAASAHKWTDERNAEYRRTRYLSLVHAYEPSREPGQHYDIMIFLMRHVPGHGGNQVSGLDDVKKAEFYFGPSWGRKVFTEKNDGGIVGVRTSAWGTFLAVCRVTFSDGQSVLLFRYVDFEMAPDRAVRAGA